MPWPPALSLSASKVAIVWANAESVTTNAIPPPLLQATSQSRPVKAGERVGYEQRGGSDGGEAVAVAIVVAAAWCPARGKSRRVSRCSAPRRLAYPSQFSLAVTFTFNMCWFQMRERDASSCAAVSLILPRTLIQVLRNSVIDVEYLFLA